MKTNKLPAEIYQSCLDFGLLNPTELYKNIKITDGVSSDIWFIQSNKKKFCIKRALKKLTVKEDWYAPINRSNFEAKYFYECKKIIPNSFPKILGHDKKKYILAMHWYDNNKYLVWKKKLLEGSVSFFDAKIVAKVLVKIHKSFYKKKKYEKSFLNDSTFLAIRIEPYILFTANSYPNHRKRFISVAKSLVENKKTLIHGDFSPKNILIGKSYPIILDAETACWGDPVFDLAFCLNHIILKSIHKRNNKKYIELGKVFLEAYLRELTFEDCNNFLYRMFELLPLLTLARVDGKSPVEYLDSSKKNKVRNLGINLLATKDLKLSSFYEKWSQIS